MATITLAYDCEVGIQSPAAMAPKIAAVDLFGSGTLDFLPFTLNSDNTVVVGNAVRRTIVLDVTAEGEAQYPTDAEKQLATRKLFSQVLALSAIVSVEAAEPVVAP